MLEKEGIMRERIRFLRWPAAIAGTIVVSFLASFALANHAPWHHVVKAKAPTKTVVATGEEDFFFSSEDWTNLPGATAKIKVPNGQRALILASFTAETTCSSFAPDECTARIMVDDRQARPASGRDFHIDTNYAGETDESQKAHAFDRSLEVGPGTYTVKVQGAAMGGTALRIDDFSFVVQRVRI